MQVQAGQLTAVLGPLGSGKSTLLSAIVGELAADQGAVHCTSGQCAAPTPCARLGDESHARASAISRCQYQLSALALRNSNVSFSVRPRASRVRTSEAVHNRRDRKREHRLWPAG